MQKTKFRIVQSEADAKIIEVLAKEIWKQHYIPIIGSSQVDYMLEKFQKSTAVLTDINEKGFEYILFEFADMPSGYYCVRFDKSDRSLFLSKFYLKSNTRGLGFGRLMLEHMIKRYDPASIWLTVNKHNSDTIDVYRHLGFEIEKTQKVDIGDGFSMDDYVMRMKQK